MKHLEELSEKLLSLSPEELENLQKLIGHKMKLTGCPPGYISDGKGGCVKDPLNPDN